MGTVYAGGELQIETFTRGTGEFGVSYHALVGADTQLSPRIRVLGDAGLGVTQQVDAHIAILGGEDKMETEAWVPSGAVRLHLLAELGMVGATTWSLGLTADARSTVTGDSAGVGLGLGLVIARP
jgi:hypothetical protein